MTAKRIKRNSSARAIQQCDMAISRSVGNKGAASLRIPGKNRYAIPSSSIPHHKYIVHLTPTNSRNSCTCEAHTLLRIRPCKHVIALKKVLGMQI
jgi:hypothetical protein